MDNTEPQFPDYGESGDLAGARRSRRAFRFCVFSCVVLTGMMWFTERFLRYDQREYLYLSALTLPKESARVMLQQAIKKDAESGERPTAKYTQALAVREEADVILDVYQRAYDLDPADSMFALRYGAELFLSDPVKAAEIFRRAAQSPPRNALPIYLEAASLARSGGTHEALEGAMVLVARANNMSENLIFPRPLWFAGGALPRTGYWYADLSREIVDKVTAPLYEFTRQVLTAVDGQVQRDQTPTAKIWLEQLRVMGERLVKHSEHRGVRNAIAGVYIQRQAVSKLEEISIAEGGQPSEELLERRVRLEQAWERLAEFEEGRFAAIEADRQEYLHPRTLFMRGGAAVFGLYALTLLLHRVMRLRKRAWAIPHSVLGKVTLGVGALLLFMLPHLFTVFQQVPGAQEELARGVEVTWWSLLGGLILFGLIYPALTLKSVEDVSRSSGRPEEMGDMLLKARKAYRVAYAALIFRYYGILAGLYVVVVCLWVITFRIVRGLYPWQTQLLVTGLLEEEAGTVAHVVGLLS